MDELNFERIGRKIKERRIELSLTQDYMATILDVNSSHISNIENGRAHPSLAILVKIANILQCSVDEFLGSEYIYDSDDTTVYPIDKQIQLALDGKSLKVKQQILSIINIL